MNRKERIFKRLNEHYRYLESKGFEIVAMFVQGSQNYNNDVYDDEYTSDIDTKAIVLPTFEDFVKEVAPTSTTLILDNDEHIDVKDVRAMFDVLSKSNVYYLEVLFTQFKIVNPKYEDLIAPLFENSERLAMADKKQLINCIAGVAKQKYCALKHPYPTIVDKINKFGYDPKQLNHIIRMNYFLKRILSGESFKSSLDEGKRKEYLIAVKKGLYSLEEAEKLAFEFDNDTSRLKENALANNEFIVDSFASNLYKAVKYFILKRWFKEQVTK